MPSSSQRLEVWRGIRAKTSGGLTKADLVKNKRGKIVSKKKSSQAFQQNNLGDFLRKKGAKVPKEEMLYKKGAKKPTIASKKPEPPKVKPEKKPKKKAQPVAAPKKKQPVAPKKKRKLKKKTVDPGINPVTKQPYAKKSGGGYVEKAAVHVDNIRRSKRVRKKRVLTNVGSW